MVSCSCTIEKGKKNKGMSSIEKTKTKFFRKPIPTDITMVEVERLANYFGCKISHGANHLKIVHPEGKKIVPIPRHSGDVRDVYIRELKELFEMIMEN